MEDLGREILSLTIRASHIDRRDAKRFDSFLALFSTAKLNIAALMKSQTILDESPKL